jgi:hypothetical protein
MREYQWFLAVASEERALHKNCITILNFCPVALNKLQTSGR